VRTTAKLLGLVGAVLMYALVASVFVLTVLHPDAGLQFDDPLPYLMLAFLYNPLIAAIGLAGVSCADQAPAGSALLFVIAAIGGIGAPWFAAESVSPLRVLWTVVLALPSVLLAAASCLEALTGDKDPTDAAVRQ
jgi:hypothetical protein